MYISWCFPGSNKICFPVLDDSQSTFSLKAVCKNEVKIIQLYYYWDLNCLSFLSRATTLYMFRASYYQNIEASILYKVFYFGSKVFICIYNSCIMITVANIS